MPELPEVEIVKQSLVKKVINKKINRVVIYNRNLRFKIDKNLEKNIKNKQIVDISRKSKYLIIHLNEGKFLLIHFGMSGTLHLSNNEFSNKITNLSFYNKQRLPKKHNHIVFFFSKFKLIYNDPRRFGFVKLLYSDQELKSFLRKYGPEPMDVSFNFNYLKKKIKGSKKKIKNLLLDQEFISGIGNIYASEILYYSKIRPNKIGRRVKNSEIKQIEKFSKHVLKKAIKKGGSSIRNFINSEGLDGSYQKEFKVYDREGKECSTRKCNGFIKKIVISNRSTFYCKNCQK